MKRIILRMLSYILVAALASAATFGIMEYWNPYSKLSTLEKLIETVFIGEADPVKMEDAAAEAMVNSLGDRWSYYVPASKYESFTEQMENSYLGIGITILEMEDGSGLRIETVLKDSPALEAGLQPNDIIVRIEDQSAAGMTTAQAKALVKGDVGTTVHLTVLRMGEGISVNVVRRQIQLQVAYGEMLNDRVGLVRIENFDTRCAAETIAAIDSLIEQGAKMLVFDIRYNPGGYAEELVKVLDYLLPEGELFRTVDYAGNEHVDMSDAACIKMPMAVLVNGNSYSAAEFFAAALRDYKVAVVVGEQTCGKGYFQSTFRLKDGSAVGISIGKYFTPKGESLADVGITPDVPIALEQEQSYLLYIGKLPREEDPQLIAAVDYLESHYNMP